MTSGQLVGDAGIGALQIDGMANARLKVTAFNATIGAQAGQPGIVTSTAASCRSPCAAASAPWPSAPGCRHPRDRGMAAAAVGAA